MKYAVLMFCMCLVASVESAAEEKIITVPAPNAAIDKAVTVIYCDTVLGTLLGKMGDDLNHRSTGDKAELYASADNRQTDRLVIEISGQTVYVHHREDFEKGELYVGQSSPLSIVRGSAPQGIIAFGFDRRLKSATVSAFSLNRTTGVGLWTLTKDALWAKDDPQAKDYPVATAAYLSCGDRKK